MYIYIYVYMYVPYWLFPLLVAPKKSFFFGSRRRRSAPSATKATHLVLAVSTTTPSQYCEELPPWYPRPHPFPLLEGERC